MEVKLAQELGLSCQVMDVGDYMELAHVERWVLKEPIINNVHSSIFSYLALGKLLDLGRS